MRGLSLLHLWTVHKVIQSVEGTDRLGVFGCPGDLRRRIVRTARRAGYLTSKRGSNTQTRQRDSTDRSRHK
jgi:hypothetical protein